MRTVIVTIVIAASMLMSQVAPADTARHTVNDDLIYAYQLAQHKHDEGIINDQQFIRVIKLITLSKYEFDNSTSPDSDVIYQNNLNILILALETYEKDVNILDKEDMI